MCKKHFACLLAGCVLFFFIYPPLRLYFLSDDWDSLSFSLQPNHILHSFRPLSDATLYLDYKVWKLNAGGFHLTNLLLHFLCVFCVYFFSKFFFLLRNSSALSGNMSLAASLLFLFYPFHSEALFWIVGRGAILCTFFTLLSFIFFIKNKNNLFYYFLSLLCFAAALLSYEAAWIVPVIITLLAFVVEPKKRRNSLFFASFFWLAFFVYLTGRYWLTNELIGTPYGSQRVMSVSVFLLCKNLAAFILRSVVIPMQSSVLFSVTCFIVAIFIATLLFIIRKKINFVSGITALFFLVSLLPVLPFGINTHTTESERFLYLPSVFFILFFASFFNLVFEKKTWLLCVLLLAEGFGLWRSYQNFTISSDICRATATGLSKIETADTLFCTHLPDEYKGAFIFRNGFESAVKLIKKDSVGVVVILSRSQLFHPQKNYGTQFIKFSSNQNKTNVAGNRNVLIDWEEDKVVFRR